ncbi:MAG TPA: TetR/AcrR family transcriptional regulator [Terracidiphilus sp.]
MAKVVNKPGHPPEDGKRARTRKKLIEAAAAVIAEKGFDRASLEEIAALAGMTRGAVYGNFKNKEELFLALIETRWKPIIPPLKAGAGLKEQMRIVGRTVAEAAKERRKYAAVATSFQLYTLTHAAMQAKVAEKNAAIYRWIEKELVKVIPAKSLPMPAKRFVRVLDVVTTGLLFKYFQTPELITEDVFVAAFEALA